MIGPPISELAQEEQQQASALFSAEIAHGTEFGDRRPLPTPTVSGKRSPNFSHTALDASP